MELPHPLGNLGLRLWPKIWREFEITLSLALPFPPQPKSDFLFGLSEAMLERKSREVETPLGEQRTCSHSLCRMRIKN